MIQAVKSRYNDDVRWMIIGQGSGASIVVEGEIHLKVIGREELPMERNFVV